MRERAGPGWLVVSLCQMVAVRARSRWQMRAQTPSGFWFALGIVETTVSDKPGRVQHPSFQKGLCDASQALSSEVEAVRHPVCPKRDRDCKVPSSCSRVTGTAPDN